LEEAIGILSQDLTTYNPINTILFLILAVVTILVGALTKPPANEAIAYKGELTETAATVEEVKITAADKMNGSRILMYLVGIAGLVYIVYSFATNGIIKSLNFNFVIFLFLTLNAFLYNTPHKFVTAFRDSMKPATEVMMQFPFYGGIMGMMAGSGLTKVMADGLIQVATVQTLPLFSYYSASVVNLFVPSQGGQWIVQGPVLVEAAKSLNADISLVINAFVFGDEATNLIQPLYIIPALSLVGMKLKEVWGFMAFIWLVWFIVTSLGLLVLPGLF
jgi:short-chain fatty acids transporter